MPVVVLLCGAKAMEGLLWRVVFWAWLVLGPELCSAMSSICAGVKALAVGFRGEEVRPGAWLCSEEAE